MIQVRNRGTCQARVGDGSRLPDWEDVMSEAMAHLASALEGMGRLHDSVVGNASEQSRFEMARFGVLLALDVLEESSVASWLSVSVPAPRQQGPGCPRVRPRARIPAPNVRGGTWAAWGCSRSKPCL